MKRLFCRLAPAATLGVFLAGACAPNNTTPPGAPVLTSFAAIDPSTGGAVDLTVVDGSTNTVPQRAHLFALFDRLLDAAAVTMLDPDGGADQGRDDLAMITTDTVGTIPTYHEVYTPNGGSVGLFFMQGPSIIITASPVFPSASVITVILNKSKIHSQVGADPFTGAGDLADGRLTFTTSPFTATIGAPMADADGGTDDAGAGRVNPTTPAQVSFSSLTDSAIADHITVTADGVPFAAVTIAIDATDTTRVNVTPTVSWPPNAIIGIAVDANAADLMGVKIDMPASGSFTTDAG